MYVKIESQFKTETLCLCLHFKINDQSETLIWVRQPMIEQALVNLVFVLIHSSQYLQFLICQCVPVETLALVLKTQIILRNEQIITIISNTLT